MNVGKLYRSLSAASSLVSERLAVRSGADGGACRRLSQSRPRVLRVGNIGLHQAVERYGGRRGTRFSVYARHWIRKEISEAINDRAPMSRIPAGRLVRLRAALDAVGSPEQLDTESRRVHRLRSHVSLDSAPSDRSRALVDMVADTAAGPEEQAVTRAVSEALVGMVEQLPGTQRHAVSQRFGLSSGEPRTCRDIAKDLGVTPPSGLGQRSPRHPLAHRTVRVAALRVSELCAADATHLFAINVSS